jgi:hypothetical protein
MQPSFNLNSFWIVPLSILQTGIFLISPRDFFSYIFLTPNPLLLLGGAILVMVDVLLNMRKAAPGPLARNLGRGERGGVKGK